MEGGTVDLLTFNDVHLAAVRNRHGCQVAAQVLSWVTMSPQTDSPRREIIVAIVSSDNWQHPSRFKLLGVQWFSMHWYRVSFAG